MSNCKAASSASLEALSSLSALRVLDLSQCDLVIDDTLAVLG
jgi:hypothetical protein